MRFASAVIALLVFLSLAVPGVASPVSADGPELGAQEQTSQPDDGLERPDPRTVISINVTGDGDARWTISSRFVVETENESRAFERLVREVKQGETDVGFDPETLQRIADESSAATGREMTIEDPEWTTSAGNGTRTLSLRFTWTNFAEKRDGQLRIGDAFNSTDGTWFPYLADGQRLVIRPPANYIPADTPVGLQNGALVWDDARHFEPGDLSATFRTPGAVTTTPPTSDTGTTTPGGEDPPSASFMFWLGLFVLVVSVGAGGYFLAHQQQDDDPDDDAGAVADVQYESRESTDDPAVADPDPRDAPVGADDPSADEGAGSQSADASAGTVTTEAKAAEQATESVDANADAATDPAAEEAEAEDDVDLDLLSDEERVERLLRQNGGRMKQANIVSETGWSNAKVSQLLSGMDEDERINKLRIGRENLITLPDEDVTDF